nr:NAD(P)/FAD-dependent oxidoreductase [Phytoactinopolyspora mesophila]
MVVGAGPAGLAAAAAAAGAGRAVAVVDSGQTPGGQYWRYSPGTAASAAGLQHDQRAFRVLTAKLRSGASYLPGRDIWAVARDDDGFTVYALHNDEETTVQGRALVLAPGAYDRQLPFPGWDLPGVYTAGGAQALLKGHGVRVGTRVVVGGTGPFLLPVAAGLARHGVDVRGVFEANHPIAWARHTAAAIRNVGKIAEGSRYAATLARHRVRVRAGHAIVAAHGDDHVEAATVVRLTRNWQVVPGSSRIVACDAVAVGWGFTPRLELPLALGCATRVDSDGSLVVDVDEHQATDIPGVFAAGEVGGVGGAALAVVEGEIAGHAAASYATVAYANRPNHRTVGDVDAVHGADGHRKTTKESSAGEDGIDIPHRATRKRERLRNFATAMHDIYPVRDGWRGWLRPDTVVCRCEEVPLAAITEAVHELGATDARTVKLFSRAGMGWCQGRTCGFAVSRLTAAESGTATDPRGLAERPVATPIPLGLLARRSTPPPAQTDSPEMADQRREEDE